MFELRPTREGRDDLDRGKCFKHSMVRGPTGAFPQATLVLDRTGQSLRLWRVVAKVTELVFELSPPGAGSDGLDRDRSSLVRDRRALKGNGPNGGLIVGRRGKSLRQQPEQAGGATNVPTSKAAEWLLK